MIGSRKYIMLYIDQIQSVRCSSLEMYITREVQRACIYSSVSLHKYGNDMALEAGVDIVL